jgi:parallel beta-helix repeat protein
MDLDNIELRYFGQNNLRAGVELIDLRDAGSVNISSVAFNRGYFRAVDIQNTDGTVINGNLIFRSHLPSLRIQGGKDNIISNNLAIGT